MRKDEELGSRQVAAPAPARQKAMSPIHSMGQRAQPGVDLYQRTKPTNDIARSGRDRFDQERTRRQIAAGARQCTSGIRQADNRQMSLCRQLIHCQVEAEWDARACIPQEHWRGDFRRCQKCQCDRGTEPTNCCTRASTRDFGQPGSPTIRGRRTADRQCGRRAVETSDPFPCSDECRACVWPCAKLLPLRQQ